MDSCDVLFVHWPVDQETLQARLPLDVQPRIHDGSAWLGVVFFVTEAIRPRGVPRAAFFSFGEANLRTYRTASDDGDGICSSPEVTVHAAGFGELRERTTSRWSVPWCEP